MKRTNDWAENSARYLRINRWLQNRYRDANGWLILHYSGDEPSRYTVLDVAFWKRYVMN